MTPMNLATQLTSVDRGGQGLHLLSLVDPIGQQLTNTAAAALRCIGDDDDRSIIVIVISRFLCLDDANA